MKKSNWQGLALITLIAVCFLTYVFWDKSREAVPSPLLSLEPTPSMAANTKTQIFSPTPDASATPAVTNQGQSQKEDAAVADALSTTAVAGLTHLKKSGATPTPVDKPVTQPLVEVMPKIAKLRDEVRQNPHEPPQSGVAFAMMLGDREKTALESEEDSKNFMTELEACVLVKDPALKYPSIQAVCLQTARELKNKWPSLNERYELLMKNADPKAAGIARSTF